MRTRSQNDAVKAWKALEKTRKKRDFDKAAYGSMAHKLPVLIRTCGLTQAVSFVAARDNHWHICLLDDVASTLGLSRAELLQRSREASLKEYRHLTRRSLDVLLHFKRFAESELDVSLARAEETA